MNHFQSTHRDRLERCLSGEKPDRVPVALWRHFPVDDQSAEGLAAATIAFQNQYDFDLIKVSPSSSYCLDDWGVRTKWTGNGEGTRDYLQPLIQKPEDWTNLPVLNPTKGMLGSQLKCQNMLTQEYGKNTPRLQTIFNPLSQAKNLVGRENLTTHLRKFPDALHAGLETITKSTIAFIEKVITCEIDGLFFAVQHAQYGLLSPEEYDQFGKPYDLRILEAANELWLNMVHLHGNNVMFDKIKQYPVAIINWHDRSTPPNLREAQNKYEGVLCGGLRQWETMVRANPHQVQVEAREAISATNGKKFILGTGCVSPIITPHGNFMAARKSVEGIY
jgi:uroporphyrinogen decarboxylase